MREQIVWTEKYRPHKIQDCILPPRIKKIFQDIVDSKELPFNLLLAGGPGMGKTTVARALAYELIYDIYLVNCSENGNIDTLRTKIRSFASTVSLGGGRKMLILDEADFLNPVSTQPALRGFMEEFARNTSFVLTCNYKNRILKPISESRCTVIDFRIDSKEKPLLAAQFMKRVSGILKQEGIKYSDKVVAELITKYFPDFRRVLNELQKYSVGGEIDEGILTQLSDVKTKELIKAMKEKNFDKVRKWTVQSLDNDPASIYRSLYDSLYDYFAEPSIPIAILKIADYTYKSAFVVDQEINLVACLIELMVDCEFK